MSNTNLTGALAELQAHLDRLTQERDHARSALHAHREAADEMARKHKEEIERMEREHGDDSRYMDAVCGALGDCPSDGAADRVRRLQESNASQAKRIGELERALAARPVVESDTVTRLREVCVALNRGGKDLSLGDFHAALNAFLASAPPAAAPAPVERDVDRELREKLEKLIEYMDGHATQNDWVGPMDNLRYVGKRWLSAPLAADEYVSAWDAYMREYSKGDEIDLAACGRLWERIEKLYDARQRGGAGRYAVEESTFDSKAVPYLDPAKFIAAEPTRSPLDIAARELAEAHADWKPNKLATYVGIPSEWGRVVAAHNRYLALRNAGGDAGFNYKLRSDVWESALIDEPAPPSPRETVYVLRYSNGSLSGGLYSESQRGMDTPEDGAYWLALDAVRVEGPQ